MYFFPNCPKPFEDELMLSWFCRLAARNVMSFHDLMDFVYGETSNNVDIQKPLQEIFKRVKQFMWPVKSISELFMKTSLYPYYVVSMTPEQQTRYVYGFMSDKDDYIFSKRGLLGKIKVCPECLKEDYNNGGSYLHRSHQVGGVHVCHKHGCNLLELPKDKILLADDMYTIYQDSNFVKADFSGSHEEAVKYAKCAYKLLNASLDTNIFEVRAVLNRVLKDKGYAKGLKSLRFMDDFNKSTYSDVGKKLNVHSVVLFNESESMMAGNMLPLLMFVYDGDISVFIKEIRAKVHNKISVPAGFELSGPADMPVKTYRCRKCGEFFISTDWGIENGLGCPKCIGSEADFYESLMKSVSGDEYEILEAVKDKDTPVKLRHKVCDECIRIKPVDFVFRHKRCECKNKVSFKEAAVRVAKIAGYELVKFTKTTEKAVICHTGGCGKTFECLLSNFLNIPFCRACEGRTDRDSFVGKVKALVGNDYTPVSQFETWHKPVRIKHNQCGKEFEMEPANFLQGNRCPHCAKVMTIKYLCSLVDDLTLGHYSIIPRDKFAGFEDVIDNVTGKVLKLTKKRIKQEVLRPTRSDVLILTEKEEAERLKKLVALRNSSIKLNNKEILFNYLCVHYGKNDLIFSDELEESGFDRLQIKSITRNLCNEGRICRLYVGIYILAGNSKDYSIEEILYNKYVCRNGRTIGKLVKASEGCFKEDRYLSTKISIKTTWREYSVAGVKVFGKGITPEQLEKMIK